MSEAVVTVEDASARLAELVDHVSAKRETAVIVKAGRPIARIVPVPTSGDSCEDLIDFLRRWRAQYPDPDEELVEVVAQTRQGVKAAHDPWE